jgi:hypothetical protein
LAQDKCEEQYTPSGQRTGYTQFRALGLHRCVGVLQKFPHTLLYVSVELALSHHALTHLEHLLALLLE